jgi:phosphoribosylamine--glycine ligase
MHAAELDRTARRFAVWLSLLKDTRTKGVPLYGIVEAERVPDVVVFHAGTSFDGALKTSGGRVLGVTATGDTLRDALERAYEAAKRIEFEGMQYRRDIGAKSLAVQG